MIGAILKVPGGAAGVLTNPAALLLIGLADTSGYFKGGIAADRRCDAAALESKNAALQLDLKTATAAAKR